MMCKFHVDGEAELSRLRNQLHRISELDLLDAEDQKRAGRLLKKLEDDTSCLRKMTHPLDKVYDASLVASKRQRRLTSKRQSPSEARDTNPDDESLPCTILPPDKSVHTASRLMGLEIKHQQLKLALAKSRMKGKVGRADLKVLRGIITRYTATEHEVEALLDTLKQHHLQASLRYAFLGLFGVLQGSFPVLFWLLASLR